MQESKIEILTKSSHPEEISGILKKFIQNNEGCFQFPNLSGEQNNRLFLWTAVFQHLQNKELQSVHYLCLTTIRILSREKTDLDNILCEKWVIKLIECAGLYNLSSDTNMMSLTDYERDMVLEAMKALCNLAFHSEVARALLANANIGECVMSRLTVYKDVPFRDTFMMFDLKLLFVLTALRDDIKAKIRDEYQGMEYFTDYLYDIVVESSNGDVAGGGEGRQYRFIQDSKQIVACEILKAQFNLMVHSGQDMQQKPLNDKERTTYEKLMSALLGLLTAQCSTKEKKLELHNNIVNLLVGVPPMYFPHLTPVLKEGETSKYMLEGRNMDAIQALLNNLENKFNITTETGKVYDNLAPILTVMVKSARSFPPQRKYLRQAVLPPLRDVSQPPEQGNTLRNQCCKLLTTPVTSIRDLVAEFLFILCKEKVSRMIKYTGFGNAAGHLAQKGLLYGLNRPDYSSSEDSDTEEYLEALQNIDPVVGCTRPKKLNSIDDFSDEQKEHEAMKLVNLFNDMMAHGVVKPARIGPDGKPQPIEHVCELLDSKSTMTKSTANSGSSSDDSDEELPLKPKRSAKPLRKPTAELQEKSLAK